MEKLKRWLYALAIAISSALLVAFAYDIEQGTTIELSSTQIGKQKILIFFAETFGLKGSIVIASLTTGLGLYFAIRQHVVKPK